MARAMLKPEGEVGRPKKGEKSPTELGFSSEMVRMARVVLRYDEALARSVMSGAETLNAAYETAKANATAKDRAAEAEKARREQLDTLRQRYPDLARKVEDGEIGVAAALVEAREKDTQARSQRDTIFRAFKQATSSGFISRWKS